MKITRKKLWILGACLLLISFIVILIFGRSYTFELKVSEGSVVEDFSIDLERDDGKEIAKISDVSVKNGKLHITLDAKSRGKTFLSVTGPDNYIYYDVVYVHRFNIMTINSYMGFTRGSNVVPACGILFLLVLLYFSISELHKGMTESLYQYKNVRNLSWSLFTGALIINLLLFSAGQQALVSRLEQVLHSASALARVVFPLAIIMAVLLAISNIRLLRKEGFTWRNMLGIIMSAAIIIGTVIPTFLTDYVYSHVTIVDFHNQRAVWPYLDLLVTNLVLILVSYLEVVLLSTIILTTMAAKRTPAFNKDYIVILGCQIRKDGTLTKLLQGRADAALDFSKKQERFAQKAPVFVPSGGQGSDEVISEAQAIKNYLLSQGIPEDRILLEDQSTSTAENMMRSRILIHTRKNDASPVIAFATTNYHVFRSGVIANSVGLRADGIGSKTRSYFWVNAFIREFIATLEAEKKNHRRVVRALSLLVTLSAVLVYLANLL